MLWRIELRGGAYDGMPAEDDSEVPQPVLIAWVHQAAGCPDRVCPGHFCYEADHPEIVLKTAETYRRRSLRVEEHVAVYEAGAWSPDDGRQVEEHQLIEA